MTLPATFTLPHIDISTRFQNANYKPNNFNTVGVGKPHCRKGHGT